MRWCLVGLLALVVPVAQGLNLEGNCHLHAPADYPSFANRPLVIPGFADWNDCELRNRRRFDGQGRCHCGSDSQPRPADPLRLESPEMPLM